MLRFADLKFRSLTRKDWLEAFIHIPDVAETVKAYRKGTLVDASGPTGEDFTRIVDRLERMLGRYQRKFGHRFIPLDDSASLEMLAAEIVTRYRRDPGDEMEMVCNHRRRLALHQLGVMIATYRPQQGDGIVVESAVSGEELPEPAEQAGAVPNPKASSATVDR